MRPFSRIFWFLRNPADANGKLGQYSNANTGLRSPCSNIHPKNILVKIRTNFHVLTRCRRVGHFSEEKRQERFASALKLSPLQRRMITRLSDSSPKISTIGSDLFEYSSNLPAKGGIW